MSAPPPGTSPLRTAASPWQAPTPGAAGWRSDGEIALVEGRTFCISARSGDVFPTHHHGLFVLDTRVISHWEVRLNDQPLEPLTVEVTHPFSATFVGRAAPTPGAGEANIVVFRHRDVGRGMRERFVVSHHGMEDCTMVLDLGFDADFADLFEVKEGQVHHHGRYSQEYEPTTIRLGHHEGDATTHAVMELSEPAEVEAGRATWTRTLAPGEHCEICVDVVVRRDGALLEPQFRCGEADADTAPVQRQASWRARLPLVDTDNVRLLAVLERSAEDLGALRIFDPDHPDTPILAAGVPWFMTVFGRDSLITAWMTVVADRSLAIGVLQTLARLQGTVVDPVTEEEPGKILHEMRFGTSASLALAGGSAYYGSIDATPLFVMLLGEARRWGLSDDLLAELLPHADRALDWIEAFGDRDGDGYVEYLRQSPDGLDNQGWKDSWDAIRWADGRLAEPPIALCEVQGYVYAAYVARAHLAREASDIDTFERYRAKALALRRRFDEDFWLDDQGTYALCLDGDKRPVDAVTSNAGHCLWTGIAHHERAGRVAERLLAPDMYSGWGVRTLAGSMAAYNPVSYHNGSVWPHDNALCAAGLARYGFVEQAHQIIRSQLAVAATQDRRLPELFAGFERTALGVPAAYPAACSPQAWAAAAPLAWLRALARVAPSAPTDRLWVAPELPPWITRLAIRGMKVGEHDVSISMGDDGRLEVDAPASLEVIRSPRPDAFEDEPI